MLERECYPEIRHVDGDVIYVRDCVLLRSGPKDTDIPYVAKVTAFWEHPHDGIYGYVDNVKFLLL